MQGSYLDFISRHTEDILDLFHGHFQIGGKLFYGNFPSKLFLQILRGLLQLVRPLRELLPHFLQNLAFLNCVFHRLLNPVKKKLLVFFQGLTGRQLL